MIFAVILLAILLANFSTQTTFGQQIDSCEIAPCNPGYQCNQVNSSRLCIPCRNGEFCPFNSTNLYGNLLALPCPSGSVCPQTLVQSVCPAGFMCPGNGATIPCVVPGTYCSEGAVNFTICPKGYYCPDTKTLTKCPSGYFCKVSSIQPVECPWLGVCPEGSDSAKVYIPLVIALGIIITALGILFFWHQRKIRNENRKSSVLNEEKIEYSRLAGDSWKFNRLNIEFRDLGLVLPSGQCILQNVSGKLESGTLTAVMGPSGCGKTTFLSVLSGRVSDGKTHGTILLNGIQASINDIQSCIGFVPQEDIVFEDLSVQENLMFSAQMRLPADMSFEDKENIVLRVMRLLDLEKIANSIVGNAEKRGISGGQRKRVNIGIELCAMPDILFLDEPTSGLDASASLKIAESLSEMAAEGMLIVAIIHQPRFSLFEKFDNVLLLGEGSTVYFGPSKEALNYFEKYLNIPCPVHENPADFFLDSITENAKLAEQWKTYSADEEEFKLSDHDTFNNLVDDLFSPKSFVDISESVPKRDLPSTMQQLYLQIVRSMRQLIYGYSEVLFEFMIHLLAGAAVGSVYGTDWDLIRFPLMVCNSSLAIAVASVTASLRVFSRDRLVFWRESSVGVSLVAYFYGKIIVQLYQVFLLSLVFTVTLRALIFPEIGFLEFYLIYCGVSWYSSGLGMLISVVIDKSAMLASIVLSMILGGFFSGAYPYLKDLNGFMLATTGIAVTRWSSEALVILESRGLPQHMNYDDQLFFTGYDKNNLSSDVAMLIFLGFLFRFFILAVLRFKRQNLNRLKWLLELKNWIALPFIILGVVASSALYFIVGYSNLLMFGPLVFSSLFYVVFMACLHYYSYKRAIIEIPSSFTLLKINYTYRSRIWLAIQFIGDSFIVAALVLTVTKLVFPDFIGWFWISLCIASTALTKIIGLAACIRQSYSKSKILFQPQTNSNICYTILLTLCTASAIYLGFAVDYKIYPIPYVSCTIPFIATLMLAVWQCLTNLNRKFKMFMFFPIVIFEIITVIRYDFQVDSHEMHWILIGTLMIYPVWISMALLFIFSRVFCACSSFCFRGFTRSAIKELLTDSP